MQSRSPKLVPSVLLTVLAGMSLPVFAADPPTTQAKTWTGHSDAVYCVTASPDGKSFASGGFDMTVKRWDAVKGEVAKSYNGHTKMVLCVAFSPDSKQMVSGGLDNLVKVWPLEPVPAAAGKPPANDFTHNFAGHQAQVYGVAFSPDGKLVASCSFDKSIKLWDLAANKEIRSIPVDVKDIAAYNVLFTPDGKSLLASYGDGIVRQFETETGKLQRQFSGAKGALYSLSLQKQGALLIAAGSEKQIYVWKMDDAKLERAIPGHEDDIYRVQFNPSGTRFCSIGYAGNVRVWDVTTAQTLYSTKLPALLFGGCYDVAGQRILAAGNDQKIHVVEVPAAAR